MRLVRCEQCGDIIEQKFNMKIYDYETIKCQKCKKEMYEISKDDAWEFARMKKT